MIFPIPPFSLNLVDVDGGHLFRFTTITIGSHVQLVMRHNHAFPLAWLISGSVVMEGSVGLDGSPKHIPGAFNCDFDSGGSLRLIASQLEGITETIVSGATSGIALAAVPDRSMVLESEIRLDVETSPLAATPENATAPALVTMPHGFSRFFADATWTL